MLLAKPIECDTDNGWPENNGLVFIAPCCVRARRVCFSLAKTIAGMQEDRDTSRRRGARDIATTIVVCIRETDVSGITARE